MQEFRHTIAGDIVTVHVPEDADDLGMFWDWFYQARERGPIALDTETTGLDIYSPGFRLRTVQFGDAHDAWVILWERGGHFDSYARDAIRRTRQILIHNAAYDWLVLNQCAGIPLEDLAPWTTDTRILAALIDPRQPSEGGIGTGLKPLSARWIDPSAPDTQAGLTTVFRSLGLTKETGWANIPLSNPTFLLYAGLDVILTARLAPILRAELSRLGVRDELVTYEHEIARLCAVMQRTGLLVDQEYAAPLARRLAEEAAHYSAVAARYGVSKIGSVAQVSEALTGMGETLTERTDAGALKVDKAVLLPLADLDRDWQRIGAREPNPLANAVLRAKRAKKWGEDYAAQFVTQLDTAGRIHASINSLQARTGRMSVSGPPLQQLPSGDHVIRRAILAEPGHVVISTDFQAIEMRVLAALADVKRMKAGFLSGGEKFDIHMYTARLVKGPAATKRDRKVFKGAGFGKVYGGGSRTLARQTGASEAEIAQAVAAYDRVFPEIKQASSRWQRQAFQNRMVFISATGRRLPLDRDRTFAVTNYACQSVARDVLGQAMLQIESAGLLEFCRLPIHDEILASAPKREAEEIAREFERFMSFPLYGVPIEAEAEIGGQSWGSLYGADY
ncbi:DNA polymerase [Streptomyces sp. AV19]|uniref:DNA polymerase n=1 Tax=Streptomyces sp. AV19 TaxID=2793068 RepID=UPI0018FE5A2F|nr:DNA polymerase [Streptomyces sp. AV19]MBH1936484.1 DNA polymerase [Streptomyces sp. AV19]MDG4532541.1 DNA polymerase [Streptomyces sp. AV19]